MKKIIALLLAAAAVPLAACGKRKADTLVMATNAEFPPYEYIEEGAVTGIDAEIAAAVAEKLGMELRIENMSFPAVLGALQTGKADFALAGLSVTPDRAELVDFSEPYTTATQAIIVRNGSPITCCEDLFSDRFYTIGVQTGFTGDIYVTDDIEHPTDENGNALPALGTVERYQRGADSVRALLSGKIDCVVIDKQVARNFVDANEGLKILDSRYAEEDYALAVPKGGSDLSVAVLEAVNELVKDGSVQKIIDRYITG